MPDPSNEVIENENENENEETSASGSMQKIKSSKVAVLLKTTDGYKRMGKGITDLPISYGAKTTSETYVDEDNATTTVDSYEIGIDTEQTAIKGEPVFDYIDSLRRSLATGSDCETEAVLVDIYNLSGDESSASGTGQKFGATIAITDFELKGGEVVKIKYKLSLNGTPSDVSVSIANKVITVTES